MPDDTRIVLTDEQKAVVADRLNNPLQVITGSMELALTHPDPDENLHRNRAALLAARKLAKALKELFNL
jgi:hypothetical protein